MTTTLKMIPLSRLKYYSTTAKSCQCPDYQARRHAAGQECKHVTAFRQMEEECRSEDSAVNHYGRTYCECFDWLSGNDDCIHILFLKQKASI